MNYYDYIAHYGVPGMKKGKRRWTNSDGTLNEAGKRRYGTGHGVLGTGGATVNPGREADGSISKRLFTYRDKNGELLGTAFSRNELNDRDHAKNIRNLRALNTTPEQRKANIEKARSNQGGKQYKVTNISAEKIKNMKTNTARTMDRGRQNLMDISKSMKKMKNPKRPSTKKRGKSFVSKFLDLFK